MCEWEKQIQMIVDEIDKCIKNRDDEALTPFDRYFLGMGEIGMEKSSDDVKVYFVTIPAHKFLCIINYESDGYWDFWQKQSLVPGQDWETD